MRRATPIVLSLLVLVAPLSAGEDPFFSHWQTFGVEEGLPSEKVMSVLVDGDAVWAGTERGLARVRGEAVEVYGTDRGLPFPVVTALARDPVSGDLWIGTMGGLARLSGGRIDAYTQLDSGLANDVIYGVGVVDETVWIATAAGLSALHLERGDWEIFDVTNTLMHEPWTYALSSSGDDVYVAVWGGGVLVRDGATGRFKAHRDPDGEMEVDLFRDDGLVHDVVSSISASGDVLWVGTYFGLSRYENRRWRSFNQEDSGLPSDFINYVYSTPAGVWIATDSGVAYFDSETWHSWATGDKGDIELRVTPPDGRPTVEKLDSGPASNMIYGVAVDEDDVWLATAAGLSRGVGAGR